jgi:hypothetical protein
MNMRFRYGLLAIAALACVSLPAAVYAQQTSLSKPAGKPSKNKSTKNKPAPAAASAVTSQPVSSARAVERPIPREQLTPIPRLTIPGGSLGYESQTSLRAYDLSDGRRVPGYDNIQRNDSSYFGLSIRMRSHAPD